MTRAAASEPTTWIGIEVSNLEDEQIAIATPDGVWWVDWDKVRIGAAIPVSTRGEEAFIIMCRLLIAARRNFPEVDRREAERLALEWGTRLDEARCT